MFKVHFGSVNIDFVAVKLDFGGANTDFGCTIGFSAQRSRGAEDTEVLLVEG
jgi:hypothetical protein